MFENEFSPEPIPYREETPIDDSRSLAAKGIGAAIFAGAAASWIFEQSPANETLRANVAFEVMERVDVNNIVNALSVGGTVAATTVVIEMVPATLISIGMNRKDGMVDRYVQRRLAKKEAKMEAADAADESDKKAKLENVTDFAVAMGIGAGAVVGKQHLKDKDPSFKKDMKTSVRASTYVALGSGAIGFVIGGGNELAKHFGAEDQAQWVVDHGAEWQTWAVVFGAIQAGGLVKRGFAWASRKIRNRSDADQDTFGSIPIDPAPESPIL